MQKTVKLLRKPITSAVIAVLFGFLVASVVLLAAGYNPAEAFGALFNGVFSKPKYISNVIIKAAPITLTAISVAFAYKAGLFNIGAEGQYIVGAIAATLVGYLLHLPAILQVPLVILSGMAAGALYGGIIGLLKARFGIHEVLTSIMLNWVALYLSNFVVQSKTFHQPNSTATYPVQQSSYTMLLPNWKLSEEGLAFLRQHKWLSEILLKTDVNFGILAAVAAALLIWFLLYRSVKGFEFRAVGSNHAAAELSGIPVKRNMVQAMLIAGALSGLAAALVITGTNPHRISTLAAFENNGFNGLSVAFIAGSSPIGCIFAGLLFGGLLYGGQSIQAEVGAPTEVINIMIGTIVFFVALTRMVPALADRLERRGIRHAE